MTYFEIEVKHFDTSFVCSLHALTRTQHAQSDGPRKRPSLCRRLAEGCSDRRFAVAYSKVMSHGNLLTCVGVGASPLYTCETYRQVISEQRYSNAM